MQRLAKLLVAILCLAPFVASSARADDYLTTVSHVAVSTANNTVQVFFNGLVLNTTCGANYKVAASLSTTAGEKLLDLALAAQVQGKGVQATIDLQACTAGSPTLLYLKLMP